VRPAAARAGLGLLAGALVLCGCGARDGGVTLRFWAMGREGEVVEELVRDFERENPGIRVEVQQIPWTAAHEKLLTAHVGEATPDVAQLGNSWISEFVALRALLPLDSRVATSSVVNPGTDFPGVWQTNVVDGATYGVPWYVDTRVLFYRTDLLRDAGYAAMPRRWDEWRSALEAIRRRGGPGKFGVFLPANEWMQPVLFGMQSGATLLADSGSRAAFREPAFRRAFTFYADLFRDSLAPALSNSEIANMYQEFDRGTFAMVITGPWNLGEFRRRLPEDRQHTWSTAPLPGPDGPGLSFAGGSSLVCFRRSRHPGEAWRLIEYLSAPERQLRFYALSGDLPARRAAWADTALTGDPRIRAFGEQLMRVQAPPGIPEWENVATVIQQHGETVARGAAPVDRVLEALDREVDRLLEKRRWLIARARAKPPAGGGG
jgi:multiple sugar transport system substrate-binding protein